MSVWYPDYYPLFGCKAAACRHSCCRGWEIDVDDASAAYYRALPAPLGEDLRAALREDEEGWHFRLDGEERCPFLRTDGLCRLIRELGEDALCDICALHPRFFQELREDELWGLGLSCEEATELLLSRRELRFVCRETGEETDLAGLLDRLGLAAPTEALRYRPSIDEERRRELLERFAATEPIDAVWPRELDVLAMAPLPEHTDAARYQAIYDHLLFRQIERAEELGWARIAGYARLCTDLIVLWDALAADTAEHVRRLSEQIEYSTENVDILIG